MKINPKIAILISTILVLSLLLILWVDELAVKQMGFLGYQYEMLKIVLHSLLAYFISKLINKKFRLTEKIKSINPNSIFLITFLILNSYIICQYMSRTISHRVLNHEIRDKINIKTKELGPTGWGFETDSLSYPEFKELVKYTNLPDIPKSAENIFVHDWYEIDFNREIKFNVKPSLNLSEFYENDTLILNNIQKLNYDFDENTFQQIQLDTIKFTRYKWQTS